jgi:hypothetical protein
MSRLTSARRTAHDSATNETKGEQLITLEAERQQLQTAVTPPRRLRRYDALGIFATRSTRSATATPGSGSGAPPATWAQAGVPLLVDLRDGTTDPRTYPAADGAGTWSGWPGSGLRPGLFRPAMLGELPATCRTYCREA